MGFSTNGTISSSAGGAYNRWFGACYNEVLMRGSTDGCARLCNRVLWQVAMDCSSFVEVGFDIADRDMVVRKIWKSGFIRGSMVGVC